MASLQGELARRKPRLRGYFALFKVINIYGGADIICPRNLHKFIGVQPVGCGDSTHRCRASGTKSLILPTVGTALAAVRYRRSRYNNFDLFIYN